MNEDVQEVEMQNRTTRLNAPLGQYHSVNLCTWLKLSEQILASASRPFGVTLCFGGGPMINGPRPGVKLARFPPAPLLFHSFVRVRAITCVNKMAEP